MLFYLFYKKIFILYPAEHLLYPPGYFHCIFNTMDLMQSCKLQLCKYLPPLQNLFCVFLHFSQHHVVYMDYSLVLHLTLYFKICRTSEKVRPLEYFAIHAIFQHHILFILDLPTLPKLCTFYFHFDIFLFQKNYSGGAFRVPVQKYLYRSRSNFQHQTTKKLISRGTYTEAMQL